MAQAAINKPIYDAFLDAGASEGKAAAAARAILPSVEDAATKADVTLLKTDITLLRADMEQFRTETKADSDLLRADIERLEDSTKAGIAELKVDLLKWMAIMFGLAVAAIGLLVNL